MKKAILGILVSFFILFDSLSIYAAMGVSAEAYILMDAVSGRVLYEKNSSKKLGMASTTKIMTALCAILYSDLEKEATVSKKAAYTEGSSMYLKENEKIKLKDLVTGLMLVSGNDAAVAIAENVSGGEGGFVLMMNSLADELGLKNTSFQNPHGLYHEHHYTTASDLAKITSFAMKNKVFSEIVSKKREELTNKEGEKKYLVNHNKLLALYEGCVGVKTGFTKKTGRCLVSSVKKNGLFLVLVTLNAPDDWNDHMRLYDRAFLEYDARPLLSKGMTPVSAEVEGGEERTVSFYAPYDMSFPVKKGEKKKISLSWERDEKIYAPIVKDETRLILDIMEDGKKVGEISLFAASDVKKKEKKELSLWDKIRSLFRKSHTVE